MDPDSYQQAWRAHSSQTRVTVDADLLLNEVRRNQRDFRAIIFRRDVIEIGVALLLLPYWFYKGATSSLPWTWYLTVPVLVWLIVFLLVDRIRHPQKPSEPSEPLLSCATNSLTQVEHQIWLLRNVFWWYLLPPTISIMAFFAHVTWLDSEDWLDVLGHAPLFIFLLVLYSFIDWLNQRAVTADLEPRRQELLTLIASLGDESSGELNTASPAKHAISSKRIRRWPIVAVSCLAILVVIALTSGSLDSSYDQPAQSSGPAGETLAGLITDQRKEKNLVGLAAMVMVDGRVEAAAAHGERKIHSDVPIEIGDRWHLGGITKSITATMIARLVESGEMQWSDSIGQSFPNATIHEGWKPVTLAQLLTDTAGAPANFPREVSRQRPPLGPECTLARREAVLGVVAKEPEHSPGERYVYSNVSHTIAAAMAEQTTGANWEDLVKREVFEPLELTGAGFGPPKSPDKTVPQPRGHRTRLVGKIAVDDQTDNTFIMGPAGIVHMTLRDLCTYAMEHLRGEAGEGKLLTAETYKLLHTPALNDYAYGWGMKKPIYEIPYDFYWHNGSNTMWYALVVFIPDKNVVIAVTSNDGDSENAESAAWEIVKTTAQQFNSENDAYFQQSLPSEAFPKKAPFAAVRWNDLQPEIKIGEEWFKLVSLDDIPVSDIVQFCRQTHGNRWRKRFGEDLIETLARMGHPTQDKVKLVVQSPASSETQVLEDVPMTRENRSQIWEAGQGRTNPEP